MIQRGMKKAASDEPVVFLNPPLDPEPGLDAGEAALIRGINDRMLNGRRLEEVMAYVFEATRELYPCDRLGLAFVQDDGHRVVSRWVAADYEPLQLDTGYAEGFHGSSLETVLYDNKLRIIRDLQVYAEAHPHSRSSKLLLKEGVRSSMTCPLYVEDRPVGFFFRSSRELNAYTEKHVQRHWALAGRLAQAVEKAWRIDQLQEANHAYSEMLGFVSHELKGPLGAIITSGDVLLHGYVGELQADQKQVIERMLKNADYLTDLVRDYLDLARIEGRDLELTVQPDVDFKSEILDPIIDVYRDPIRDKKLTVQVNGEGGSNLSCDAALLRVAATNLFSNAVKYSSEGGEITCRLEGNDDLFTCRIRNTGPGFPAELKDRLFRKFSRLPKKELLQRKGSGLGLYTAWRMVRLHGGRIWADSEEGAWAEFCFSIPR